MQRANIFLQERRDKYPLGPRPSALPLPSRVKKKNTGKSKKVSLGKQSGTDVTEYSREVENSVGGAEFCKEHRLCPYNYIRRLSCLNRVYICAEHLILVDRFLSCQFFFFGKYYKKSFFIFYFLNESFNL